jgi:general secretion pathway protein K
MSRRRQQGFALAAVLWLLAGLTVVVGSVSGITLSSAQRVAQLRERADFVQSAYGTRAHLLYWLSGAGTDGNSFTDDVDRVRADGSSYQVLAGSTVQLQDVGGLIALNSPNRALLRAYLASCGVDGSQTQITALVDALAGDGLLDARSAERPRLLAVGALWKVPGWAAIRTVLQSHRCAEALTAEASAATSPNLLTAPPAVLRAAGVPDDVIRARGSERRDDPAALQATLSRLTAAAGRIENLAGASPVVQRSLRVTHRQAIPGPWRLDYTLRLTPDVEGRPWEIVEPRLHASLPEAEADPPPVLPWPENSPTKQISHVQRLLSY